MSGGSFPDRPRVDAREKVLGKASYAADVVVPGVLHAMLVPSRIAKGRVTAVATAAAMKVPGVVRILLAADFPPPPAPGSGGPPPTPTIVDAIAYRGQPVALVVAETLEAAIEAAEAVRVSYAATGSTPLIDSPGSERAPIADTKAGDADAAMAGAAVRHKAEYLSPNQHHNPIEMLSTTAVWSGDHLTIYEGTQATSVIKGGVARALRLKPEQVTAKSPQTGGGFGQKGGQQRQTAIVGWAAILLGRPVKLVVPRTQIFHNATYRPLSRHRVELGADAGGRIVAVRYDADQQQARRGFFAPQYHEATPHMYGIAEYLGTAADVKIDTQAPGYMRAPHPHPACFAFESALDELAEKLGQDPVALRLRHKATTDPLTGHPYSSNHLHECIREGARRFGWSKRPSRSGATVLADGTQVGWGMACGAYPVNQHPAIATLRVTADGRTRFAVAAHEMGQGIRSTIEQVLLRDLDIDSAGLEIAIGDTSVAPQHVTAGSWGTASAVPAASEAAARLTAAVAELVGSGKGGNLHRRLARAKRPFVEVSVDRTPAGQGTKELETFRKGGMAVIGPDYPTFTSFSYIAHFVEVRVEPNTRRVRVPRVVSIADCGRVVSPRTAESQVRGGVVWAISAALREETEVDPRFGGWLNSDLADYVIAVNADIGDIDVGFIDQPDPLTNALGIKGLGEVAMVGAAAAIANAIHHATGRRLRRMPFRVEDLL